MSNEKYYEYDFSGKVIKVQLEFYKEIPDVASARDRFDTAAKEILPYLLVFATFTRQESWLTLRTFPASVKIHAFTSMLLNLNNSKMLKVIKRPKRTNQIAP